MFQERKSELSEDKDELELSDDEEMQEFRIESWPEDPSLFASPAIRKKIGTFYFPASQAATLCLHPDPKLLNNIADKEIETPRYHFFVALAIIKKYREILHVIDVKHWPITYTDYESEIGQMKVNAEKTTRENLLLSIIDLFERALKHAKLIEDNIKYIEEVEACLDLAKKYFTGYVVTFGLDKMIHISTLKISTLANSMFEYAYAIEMNNGTYYNGRPLFCHFIGKAEEWEIRIRIINHLLKYLMRIKESGSFKELKKIDSLINTMKDLLDKWKGYSRLPENQRKVYLKAILPLQQQAHTLWQELHDVICSSNDAKSALSKKQEERRRHCL